MRIPRNYRSPDRLIAQRGRTIRATVAIHSNRKAPRRVNRLARPTRHGREQQAEHQRQICTNQFGHDFNRWRRRDLWKHPEAGKVQAEKSQRELRPPSAKSKRPTIAWSPRRSRDCSIRHTACPAHAPGWPLDLPLMGSAEARGTAGGVRSERPFRYEWAPCAVVTKWLRARNHPRPAAFTPLQCKTPNPGRSCDGRLRHSRYIENDIPESRGEFGGGCHCRKASKGGAGAGPRERHFSRLEGPVRPSLAGRSVVEPTSARCRMPPRVRRLFGKVLKLHSTWPATKVTSKWRRSCCVSWR